MIFNLSKREKRISLLTGGVILFALLYNFLFEPMVKIWVDLDKQILTKEIRLKKNLQTISQREIIESKYARYVGLIPVGGESPDEKRAAELLSEIERIASDAAVRINEMKPRQVKDFESYRKFTIELETEASIADLLRFIYDLESQPRFLKVEKLRLNAKDTQSHILKCYILIMQISVDRKQ